MRAPDASLRLCARAVALLLIVQAAPGPQAAAQAPVGKATVEALEFPPLDFDPPEAGHREVEGVPVLVLESHELPLVNVYAYFRGGYGLFGREWYAAAMGLPTLLRYGGTTTLAPDSVDEVLERLAIQTSFGSAGGSISSGLNTLTEHLEPALELWGELLASPGFDTAEIEVWRGRQIEGVRRLGDDPARLAFSEFNRLLFGDHPIGWEMESEDLLPERVTPERFREVHARIVCRDNLVLGLTGDAAWDEVRPWLERLVSRIRPCAEELPEPPTPDILRSRGVYVIEKDLEQAVVVMAHPSDVRLSDTPDYYSAMIANSILGAGGFSSRIMARVRTERGYAYGASSVWTTPREHEGIVGAITRTSPENAVAAIEVILDTMAELEAGPPTREEVETAISQVVNGFVFNFETPAQVVSRTMLYLAQDLPEDWLERYWRGVQAVTPASIQRVFSEHLRPREMTILIVGDPERIGRDALAGLGPVTVLEPR